MEQLDKLNQYWTYIPFMDSKKNKKILAFFDILGYENMAFIYSNTKMDGKLFTEVSSIEELELLQDFTEEENKLYLEILNENGITGYYLYKFLFNKENIDNFINALIHNNSSNNTLIKGDKLVKKFENFDNSNELTFYIILRNDLNKNSNLQMVNIVDITRTIQEDLRVKACNDNIYNSWYYDFVDLKSNIVILQASAKDLFEDNYIPSEYKDPNIVFNYIWDDEERVAQGNFRLKEGNITCLGYFGYKKDMPKFIRKLKLYGGK